MKRGIPMNKDVGEKCIFCFRDTSFGSGRFVNRIPATMMSMMVGLVQNVWRMNVIGVIK